LKREGRKERVALPSLLSFSFLSFTSSTSALPLFYPHSLRLLARRPSRPLSSPPLPLPSHAAIISDDQKPCILKRNQAKQLHPPSTSTVPSFPQAADLNFASLKVTSRSSADNKSTILSLSTSVSSSIASNTSSPAALTAANASSQRCSRPSWISFQTVGEYLEVHREKL